VNSDCQLRPNRLFKSHINEEGSNLNFLQDRGCQVHTLDLADTTPLLTRKPKSFGFHASVNHKLKRGGAMTVLSILIGFLAGMILLGVLGWLMMPGLMLKEWQSPFDVEETVEKISRNAVAEGWVVSSVLPLDESVKKHGGGDLPLVRLVNLCQADHAYKILREDPTKIVSVMMPCTISVYQKTDGKTYVGTMNAGLMGKMFGGIVAKVMGGVVAKQQQSFISFVHKKA
jgi:uncharacterized protein (DUF302 family)